MTSSHACCSSLSPAPLPLPAGARDLIPRMLLVDPLKRITIPEIRQHPWFTLHLPRYLAVMQVWGEGGGIWNCWTRCNPPSMLLKGADLPPSHTSSPTLRHTYHRASSVVLQYPPSANEAEAIIWRRPCIDEMLDVAPAPPSEPCLPPSPLQAEAVVGVPRIDEEMLHEASRLGFDRELLIDSIRSRAQVGKERGEGGIVQVAIVSWMGRGACLL